jgi:hypothetical protein
MPYLTMPPSGNVAVLFILILNTDGLIKSTDKNPEPTDNKIEESLALTIEGSFISILSLTPPNTGKIKLLIKQNNSTELIFFFIFFLIN